MNLSEPGTSPGTFLVNYSISRVHSTVSEKGLSMCSQIHKILVCRPMSLYSLVCAYDQTYLETYPFAIIIQSVVCFNYRLNKSRVYRETIVAFLGIAISAPREQEEEAA